MYVKRDGVSHNTLLIQLISHEEPLLQTCSSWDSSCSYPVTVAPALYQGAKSSSPPSKSSSLNAAVNFATYNPEETQMNSLISILNRQWIQSGLGVLHAENPHDIH